MGVVDGRLAELDVLALEVDRLDLLHDGYDVLLLADDAADGLGDFGDGEGGHGHLIEQGLEEVVVLLVDDDDLGVALEVLDEVEAGEAAAEDDDAGGVAVELVVLLGGQLGVGGGVVVGVEHGGGAGGARGGGSGHDGPSGSPGK
ncbi:MAG: hypothetical protein AAF750_14450 [Planctomycetota bacterium]